MSWDPRNGVAKMDEPEIFGVVRGLPLTFMFPTFHYVKVISLYFPKLVDAES